MNGFQSHFARLCAQLRRRGRPSDEAEDLVQEAYVRLLTYIKKGEKILEPEAFVARTVLNLDSDTVRRKSVWAIEPRAVEEFCFMDHRPGPEDEVANEVFVRKTREVLDETVGEKTRTAFFMHCFEGMTYEEVGTQLKMSGRTVERHIAKAVAVLALTRQPRP